MYFKDGQLVIDDAKESVMLDNLVNKKTDKDVVSNIKKALDEFSILFKQDMENRGWNTDIFKELK